MKKILLNVFIILLFPSLLFCKEGNIRAYKINDIRIYKNTPVWELALTVKAQRCEQINKIIKENPRLINYQEPKCGATLLLWAVGMEKYQSAETLLKLGADPNIASTSEGETPLFAAAGYSWIDTEAKKDPKFVKLLLRYRADPNKAYVGLNSHQEQSVTETGTTPLMNSIGCGIEKTKALVEGGADLNRKTKTGSTAAVQALLWEQEPEYAYYLIVEKKVTVSEPYYGRFVYGSDNPKKLYYPVDLLRDWVFDLNSKKYKIKMKIVKEFARQGINYWDTEIPKFTLEYIKKLYPEKWQEYIEKY